MSSTEPNDLDLSVPAANPYGQHAPLVPSPSVRATMNQMTERMQTVIDAAERAAEAIRFDAEEQARRHLVEAQRKADRMTAERVRLISELTDDLIRHAGQVREHSEQMVESLENAIATVSGKLEDPGLPDGSYLEEGDATLEATTPPPPPPPIPAPASVGSEPEFEPEPDPEFEAEDEPFEEEPVDGEAEAIQDESAEPEPEPEPEPVTPHRESTLRGTPISQEALLHATRLAAAGDDRESIATALREQFGVANPDPVLDRVLGVG